MARADTAAGVAMEILVEQHEIFPERIAGVALVAAVHGAGSRLVREKERGQPPFDLARYRAQRHESAGPRRALDREVIAVEQVIAVERLDQEIVEREPHRPAPVRVSAEQPRRRLARRVLDAVPRAHRIQHERVIGMHARHFA